MGLSFMATDFIMKATNKTDIVYFQVGHGQEHHKSTTIDRDLKKWTRTKLFLLLL